MKQTNKKEKKRVNPHICDAGTRRSKLRSNYFLLLNWLIDCLVYYWLYTMAKPSQIHLVLHSSVSQRSLPSGSDLSWERKSHSEKGWKPYRDPDPCSIEPLSVNSPSKGDGQDSDLKENHSINKLKMYYYALETKLKDNCNRRK